MLYLVSVVLILLVIYTMGKEYANVMASINEIKAVVDALKSETAAALERVAGDVANLKALVEAGKGIDPAALDSIVGDIQGVVDTLKAVDPDPSFPAPPA